MSGLRRSAAILVALLAIATQGWASEKEWATLKDCQYIEDKSNDGDSFRVRAGVKEFTARLYYVDAPETNLTRAERTHEQSLHFGITLDETMKAGVKATERVKQLLQKPFIVLTRYATAGGQGRTSRYYVIIEVDGKSLAEILVSEGLALTKGVKIKTPGGIKASDYMAQLESLEKEAKQKRLGAWATSTTAEEKPQQ